jgi:hypothetical protein
MPINPAYVMQGRTDHPAQLFRLALAGVASSPVVAGATAPGGGVNPYLGGRLAVTGLASLSVQVNTGLVYIPNSTAWQGLYAGFNTSTYNVSIPSASSTQWRRDYIAAVVTDPGDNTANWNIIDVAGTFSSSSPGALPSLPANAVPLAIVNVVPNMTVTNGSGTVADARLWQPLGGPWTTTSSARPSTSAPNGTMWYETDTNQLGVIINGAYKYVNVGTAADTWHTATYQNGWGPQAAGLDLQYTKLQNGLVATLGRLTCGSTFSGGPQTIATLPTGYRPTQPSAYIASQAHGGSGTTPPYEITGSGLVVVDSSGNVKVYGAMNAGQFLEVSGSFLGA